MSPQEYTYKFVVDGDWRVDPQKPIERKGDIENNVIHLHNQVQAYKNISMPRKTLNEIHKKVAIRYPEFYLQRFVRNTREVQIGGRDGIFITVVEILKDINLLN